MKASLILVLLGIGGITSENAGEWIDPRFAVDPRDFQLNEMSQNLQKISGAVMGVAELVLDIKADVRLLRKELVFGKPNKKFEGRLETEITAATVPLFENNEKTTNNVALADRVEKLLAIENNPQVDFTKDEIKKMIQTNFIRILSAMLVSGPPKTQDRKDDIMKLMKAVLNNELDFAPVVEKLPFILRDSETNQFINLMKTLREDEVLKRFREGDEDGDGDEKVEETENVAAPSSVAEMEPQNQIVTNTNNVQPQITGTATATEQTAKAATSATGTATMMAQMPMKGGLVQVIDAVGGLDISQLATFLTRLPEVFEGVENLVDGVEDYLSFGDIARQQKKSFQ